MPFHTDHRPESFSEFEGNRKTLDRLQAILKRKKSSHVFLFCGPSGCGKTTLARIMAKELGCSKANIVEIDASNNRGIDTAREIVARMTFLPTEGKAKSYILDEVHQTTKDFQNAMLKALEDTPSYVYFMLCTTEPDRLLATVRNRCGQAFVVTHLPFRRIDRLLQRIVKAEGVGISGKAIKSISENAGGCPRKALIMLDQIIDIPDDDVAKALQASERTERQVIDLCRALNECRPWGKIAAILRAIDEDPERIRHAVIGYFNKVLLNKDDAYAAMIIECFSEPFWQMGGMPGLTLACYVARCTVEKRRKGGK